MEKEEERIGIFPSWSWVYLSVIIYTAVLILFLYLLTDIFDHSVS